MEVILTNKYLIMENFRVVIDYIKKIPAFVCAVVCVNLLFCLVSLIFAGFVSFFGYNPSKIVNDSEVWRFFTSNMVPLDFLKGIIMLAAYYSTGSITERRMGSVKYSIFFFTNTILLQILYLVITLPLSLLNDRLYSPIWGLIMIETILISRKNLDSPVSFLCCPGKIKSSYYPYVVFLFGFFLWFFVEMVSGCLLGLLSNF